MQSQNESMMVLVVRCCNAITLHFHLACLVDLMRKSGMVIDIAVGEMVTKYRNIGPEHDTSY